MNLYAPATIFAQGSARQANHMQRLDVAEDHPGAGVEYACRPQNFSLSIQQYLLRVHNDSQS